MWRSFIALLLLSAPQVWAQENATAYEALRVVGTELGRGALNHIVTIAGVKGNPQPERWKIVLEDPEGRGVRELQIAEGTIDSDSRPDRSIAGSTEGATINVSRLNLDSSGAFAVASHTAEASHTGFATADYTLEGMFAGATMEDVESDYDEGEGSGVISDVKKKIKHAFYKTQDEARGMFERVKRSFSDFINRE